MLSTHKRKALLAAGTPEDAKEALKGSLRRGVMSLKELDLEVLPDAIADFAEQISALDLTGNRLRELPESVAVLEGLERLVLTKNKWRGFPNVMFALPNLTEVIGAPTFARGARRETLEAFLRNTGHLERPVRETLFQLYTETDLSAAPSSTLAQGLLGTLEPLHQRSHAALLARSAKAPITADSEVTVLGAVGFKKTALKKAVVALGARYSANPTPTTTHAVLGRSPKKPEILAHLNDRPVTFLTEQQAIQTIDAKEEGERFLTRATPEAAAHGANLRSMLTSGEKASIDLALTMIQKGGLPSEAATPLFLMAKQEPDKKLRAKARKLLKRHGSQPVQLALADRSALAFYGEKAASRTATSLHTYARTAPELDWLWLARTLHDKHRYPTLRFALDKADAETQLDILRSAVKEGALDIHRILADGHQPNYLNSYAYYVGATVPAYAYALTDITSLNLGWCHFDTLPPGISALTKLKRLDLSGNMFTKLPDEILTMTWLEELHVGMNTLVAFPKGIAALTNLKVLNIQGNRQRDPKHIFNALEAPQRVRDTMPKCTFVDGLSSSQERHNSYYT